jgi:hypothetical protein
MAHLYKRRLTAKLSRQERPHNPCFSDQSIVPACAAFAENNMVATSTGIVAIGDGLHCLTVIISFLLRVSEDAMEFAGGYQ